MIDGADFTSAVGDYLSSVVLVADNSFKIERPLPSGGVNVTSELGSRQLREKMFGKYKILNFYNNKYANMTQQQNL